MGGIKTNVNVSSFLFYSMSVEWIAEARSIVLKPAASVESNRFVYSNLGQSHFTPTYRCQSYLRTLPPPSHHVACSLSCSP